MSDRVRALFLAAMLFAAWIAPVRAAAEELDSWTPVVEHRKDLVVARLGVCESGASAHPDRSAPFHLEGRDFSESPKHPVGAQIETAPVQRSSRHTPLPDVDSSYRATISRTALARIAASKIATGAVIGSLLPACQKSPHTPERPRRSSTCRYTAMPRPPLRTRANAAIAKTRRDPQPFLASTTPSSADVIRMMMIAVTIPAPRPANAVATFVMETACL